MGGPSILFITPILLFSASSRGAVAATRSQPHFPIRATHISSSSSRRHINHQSYRVITSGRHIIIVTEESNSHRSPSKSTSEVPVDIHQLYQSNFTAMSSRHSTKIIQQIISSHRTTFFRIPTPSQCCPSSRALSSSLRKQTNHATIRCALACEASSLRYSLFMEDGEDGILRGWDAGVEEEDDGT